MKRLYLLIVLLMGGFCYAQEDAWVYFSDKPDAAFYLANPLEMLSQKALDRRTKQGIEPDEKDVPINPAYIEAVAGTEGITIMAKSKWLNALHIRGSIEAISALDELEFVADIDFANKQLNVEGRYNMAGGVKTGAKAQETAANFDYGFAAGQIEMLKGDNLHEQDFTGTGMTIAVLDAGFPGVNTLGTFARLRDNGNILGGYNYVGHSEDFYTGGNHGTLVLSTMAGYTENQLVGTAPDAFYYLFITEDTGGENPVEESYWVEAAEKADSLGVDVINTSLGYFKYDNLAYSHTYADMDGETAFITRGANVAFTRGMFCVVSAGNAGNSNTPNIGAPADALNVLTVGAVDSNENRAVFSSIGPTADGRIKPDVMAKGASATVANAEGAIATANGTSLSSPITAGLVACLWQALPDKTNAEILQLVKESADRYTNPNNSYGYGIPDFGFALRRGLNLGPDVKFIVYPAVSDSTVYLEFPAGVERVSVTLFNALGQRVMESKVAVSEPSFSITALATGIYSYRLEASGIAQTGRIIKKQ